MVIEIEIASSALLILTRYLTPGIVNIVVTKLRAISLLLTSICHVRSGRWSSCHHPSTACPSSSSQTIALVIVTLRMIHAIQQELCHFPASLRRWFYSSYIIAGVLTVESMKQRNGNHISACDLNLANGVSKHFSNHQLELGWIGIVPQCSQGWTRP